MKTESELRAFCEGYLDGALACNADLYEWDDWVLWEDYDINFIGQYYTGQPLDANALLVVAYPRDWEGELPSHLYCFVVKTSTAFVDNLPSPLRDAVEGEMK